MDLKLKGKVALVTGSSKGIGAAIAAGLAREGATVIIHGRQAPDAQRVAQTIVAAGGCAHAVAGDLTRDDDVAHLTAQARSLAGDINILINNAGGSGPGEDWTNAAPATWSATYDRNVLSALRVTAQLLPAMQSRAWGRIINIASMAALMPPAINPDYAAAKAAMLAMTASLAKAVAGHGITVNTLSPGTIHSARLEQRFRAAAASHGLDPLAPWKQIEACALPHFAHVPVGRVGTLQEISDAVCFLASPRAAYITGSNLRVDGGMLPTA
ncbi:SDR family NAD(P)-dependent oxidoreductase [Bordetella genomosp. 12]|uniref:3-oxoacyl-ACP reductase n=1 Tax=Bordetella genomosp. 12 TaxID=463035 RepID=A0A261VMY3_9BORD|nr:SDR family NAD(P)-dependent oxidoreductase [Bordetella genomosp. 12]OZI75111.1 3-oxoacyl-ACP reductase [Bordetella genomosp. 12]